MVTNSWVAGGPNYIFIGDDDECRTSGKPIPENDEFSPWRPHHKSNRWINIWGISIAPCNAIQLHYI